MKKMDDELATVHSHMQEMAEMTKQMLSLAVSALKDRSQDVHDEIMALEAKVDQMQVDTDHEAVRVLTVYTPVATNLRYMLVVTHVTAQMERIGDQVVNVWESLQLMQSDPEHGTLPELRKMADLVVEMVADCLTAYFQRDAEKAEMTRTHDDVVDALNEQIVKKLLSDEVLRQLLVETKDVADTLAQILISRHLERIADQAVNICKEVVYLVRGDDVRHVPSITTTDSAE